MVRAQALLRGFRAIGLASIAAAGFALSPAAAQDTSTGTVTAPEAAPQPEIEAAPAEVSSPNANAPGSPQQPGEPALPVTAEPPAGDETFTPEMLETDPASEDTSAMAMVREHVELLILALAILAAIPIIFWLRRKFASDDGRGARKNSPVKIKGNEPMPPYGKVQDPSEVLADYQRQIEDLRKERDALRKRVQELEAGGHSAANTPASSTSAAAASSNVYDRKNDRVQDPEDPHRGAPPPPERPAPQPESRPAEPAARAPTAASAHNADDLVNKFNSTTKPGDFTRLAESVKAQYYTNERSTDITTLIKSDIDRFWVVPDPNNSNEALLLPGFNLKKSWQKYRQEASDHPLAHHFDMQRGDKLSVIRPAVLQRDSNNEWKLKTKGAISGLS
ncbi:hypothetical protein [Aurantiacibacter sediminis]|uniref:Uncharacterized protein n=1 Tax=Aurantiacibacter sediminis TaxID=2793064 RepID=A0ABS0N693_9SPHN|nr:hypothetical protein [Aurantiacibacter sediminis]MBH5323303.1 hypothetical protein [Aurantiacibacter sediminis]